jgi:hypothetical protein
VLAQQGCGISGVVAGGHFQQQRCGQWQALRCFARQRDQGLEGVLGALQAVQHLGQFDAWADGLGAMATASWSRSMAGSSWAWAAFSLACSHR